MNDPARSSNDNDNNNQQQQQQSTTNTTNTTTTNTSASAAAPTSTTTFSRFEPYRNFYSETGQPLYKFPPTPTSTWGKSSAAAAAASADGHHHYNHHAVTEGGEVVDEDDDGFIATVDTSSSTTSTSPASPSDNHRQHRHHHHHRHKQQQQQRNPFSSIVISPHGDGDGHMDGEGHHDGDNGDGDNVSITTTETNGTDYGDFELIRPDIVQQWRRQSSIAAIILPPKKIRLFQLVAISYFCVAGGAFGIEPIVQYAPLPFWCLLFIGLFPWVWSLPTSLICAEMASLFPTEGGGIVTWSEKAFQSRLVGYVMGFTTVLANILDASLYPSMFMSYLMSEGMLGKHNYTVVYIIGAIMISSLAVLHILSTEFAGSLNVVFFLLSSSPFVAITVLGFWYDKFHWGRLVKDWNVSPFSSTHAPFKWGAFLAQLIWNNSGWYAVGYLVDSTYSPRTTFPRAMFLSNILLIIMYLWPVGVGLALSSDKYTDWNVGEFIRIGKQIGGNTMVIWFALGGMIASCGLYNSSLLTASEALAFISRNRMGPRVLQSRSKWFHTPFVAILLTSVVTCVLVLFPLAAILRAEMVINAVTQIMLYVCFLLLRFRNRKAAAATSREQQIMNANCNTDYGTMSGNAARPIVVMPEASSSSSSDAYKCPLNIWFSLILSLVPIGISIWSIVITDFEAQIAGLVAFVVAFVSFPIFCYQDVKEYFCSRNRATTSAA